MSSTLAPFPAVHSVISPAALAELVRAEYPGTSPVTCQLLRRNINDTYLVTGMSGEGRAVLRVYRSKWRSAGEVAWELSFIEHVASSVPVSRPLPRRNGDLFGVLPASEGPRAFALFEWVEGRSPETDVLDAGTYGAAAAALHAAADGFDQTGRGRLDLNHLITEPLTLIRPLLQKAPELWQELEGIATKTHERLSFVAHALEWGACHGDLHTANVRIDASGQVRLFDFDCGGPGWRAYDLAVYWWNQAANQGISADDAGAPWQAFLTAYQSRRRLSAVDVAAVPLFVLARAIWFMGLMSGRVQEFGTETLDLGFFQYGLDFMQTWEAQQGE